jgi:hypothetical protein
LAEFQYDVAEEPDLMCSALLNCPPVHDCLGSAVLSPDGKGTGISTLNKATAEVVWQSPTASCGCAYGFAMSKGKAFTSMKVVLVAVGFLVMSVQWASAQEKQANPSTVSRTKAEQEIISLSKDKWLWMSERKLDSLEALFHEDAVFVHMGGTMSRSQELDVIKTGRIHYKQADIQDVSVHIIGGTAILLNRIRLVAVVGGNEVINPFVVTEVYVQQSGAWKLASLSFTRLLGQQAASRDPASQR